MVCWAPGTFVISPHRTPWCGPTACGRRCFSGGGGAIFLLLLRELSGKRAWLSVAVKTSVRLLMQRSHLFLLRAFVTAEDFRLPDTVSIFLRLLGELQPEGWASLMHVSTSPKPVLQAPDTEVAARGLGDIGTYHISDALWDEVVGEGVDVERLALEFAPEVPPPTGGPPQA